MGKAHRNSSGVVGRISSVRSRDQLPTLVGLGLAAVLAILGLAGCVGSTASPSVQPSESPSVEQSASASLASTSIGTPSVTPTPTTTPRPTPTPTATPTPKPTPMPTLKFVATGSMHVARTGDTDTLLRNGKVLIAGGNDAENPNGPIFSSAELYDPATGRFTKTGSMTVTRANHTATLLTDGKVLIAGGWTCLDKTCDSDDRAASAELYDPATGRFSPTGSMGTPRAGGTATLLQDGRVLLTEGDGRSNSWAELYEPTTGEFTRTGTEILFDDPSSTLLPNGKVLVTGGDIGAPVAGALYDEASGKFTKISLEPAPGAAPTVKYKGQAVEQAWPGPVTVLKDGRVLLFHGGYLETYDPATGACAAAGFISAAGLWLAPTATMLNDGRVLFAGGQLTLDPATYDDEFTNSAVLYDPSSGSQVVGSMKAVRVYQTSTLLPNGNVLIAGGGDTSAELFKP
jgi:hypothetical protein